MNEITIFKNKEFGRVRVPIIDDKPYFNEAFTVPTIQITPKQQKYFINRYIITPAKAQIKGFSGKEYA